MPQTHVYDPYKWLPSMFRALGEYLSDALDASVKAGTTNIGLQAYEIVFDFPAAEMEPRKLPFTNAAGKPVTLIHFEIDNIDNRPLGFGSSIFAETHIVGFKLIEEEAEAHEITFDVGVWATDVSGGSTARLDAYGVLDSIFSGPSAQNACEELTEGVQVRSFSGGRFLTETVNDVRLYRVADCELVTFVFSSKKLGDVTEGDIVIVPELMIDETVIVDVNDP